MYGEEMTSELEKLYDKYYEKFNVEPDFYDELEYGQNDYKSYVDDIKKSIKLNIELPDIN